MCVLNSILCLSKGSFKNLCKLSPTKMRNVGSQVLTPPGVFVSVSGGGGHVDPAAGHLGQPLGLQQVAELVSALAVGDLAL